MEPSFKLEDLGSKGRLRILEAIYQHGPINISALGRRCGMNHGNIDHHVKGLVEMGLVEEKRYGNMGIRMLRPGAQRVSIQLKKGAGLKIEVDKE
jgi:DNA-binding transcriptional ArsR family regulator